MTFRMPILLAVVAVLPMLACAPPAPVADHQAAPALEFAIVIHGGAGTIPKTIPDEQRDAYTASLEQALELGRRILDEGGTSLDAVEQVIVKLEDDPLFNAGRGAVYNHEGSHELDASIMDGKDLSCGAVAGVTTVKNPILLARWVKDRSGHVLLAGLGAEQFADEMGVERVPSSYFGTERRLESWRKAQEAVQGTVGVAALDRQGNLAAGTSTGGLTNKRFGRVGDSPIIGAGTYADNRTCAVSATGKGEEYIRHGVARLISSLVQHGGMTLPEAARHVIHEVLEPGDGGIIGVDARGTIVMEFNTPGMYRGAADSSGRFETAMWE